MTLIPTGEIISSARDTRTGVGSFNVIQLEHAEAIAAGSEAAGVPVILQISENCVAYHGGLTAIGAATLAVARNATTPVAVHLDHATRAELVHEAAELGFGSVMFDASTRPYADNIHATAAMAAWCHSRGVWVEAELGEVGGKNGVHAPGARTDPTEAAHYVDATGVDALAVAVGTSHAMLTRDAAVDFDLIAGLRTELAVPLVLHGSSGVPDADLSRAVQAGMTKINIGTQLNKAFTHSVRRYLSDAPDVVDPRKYLGAGRDAISREVQRLLRALWAGTGCQLGLRDR